jgi:drug/metabolite transporter (DMT)-like permease
MSWFYLAILAPLFFAMITLLDDNLLRHVYKGALPGSAISGCFAMIPAALILLFNRAAILDANLILILLAAGGITVVGYYFYFRGLESDDPSVIAAILCLMPAAIPLVAHFLVGEELSGASIIGFGLLIATGFIYSLSDIRHFKFSKALIPVTIAAVAFDVAAVANKYVFTKADFYAAYLYFALGMAIAGVGFLIALKQRRPTVSIRKAYRENSRKILLLLILVEGLSILAEFIHGKALSLGPVSLVQGLENLQSFYVLLIAIALFPFYPKYFREAESGQRTLKFSLLFVMVGAALLTTL